MISKIATKLPQVKLRGLGQLTQRQLTTPSKWREQKSNVQAIAGRSFEVLKRNFLAKIQKLLLDFAHYNNDLILLGEIDKEVKASYRKAYMLGLKASGLTLYEKNTTFKKVSLPTLDPKESEWLNQTIFDKKDQVEELVHSKGQKLLKQVELELLRYYQYGRIVGAPIYSFVYFNCTNKDCQHLVDNSPWPREKVEDFCPSCSFKIVPKSSTEYRDRINNF